MTAGRNGRDALTVEIEAAAEFLAGRFGPGVESLAPAGAGAWSRAFSFRHLGADLIVRFGAHVEDFEKDRIAASFRAPALPIPAVIEVGEAFGGFYAVSERAFGKMLDELDEAGVRAALPALFRGLDELREVGLGHTSGFGLWRADRRAAHTSWRGSLLDVAYDHPALRTHGWRERLDGSRAGSAAFTAGYSRLQSLVGACPEDRFLIHADLLNRNVLVAGDQLSAVFDWGCSMYGDFLYDVAWLSLWGPWYPAMRAIDVRAFARQHYRSIGLPIANLDERLDCYELHVGLGGLAYQAFAGHRALAWTAERVSALAGSR